MKQTILVLMVLGLLSCNSETTTEGVVTAVNGVNGTSVSCSSSQSEEGSSISCSDGTSIFVRNGQDGTSCNISQQENGAMISCGDNSVFVMNGSDGQNATQCSVEETEYGAVISCNGEQVSVYNGTDGQNATQCSLAESQNGVLITCGEDSLLVLNGQDGDDSEGSNVTLVDYSGNSCTKISGTNSYVKSNGSNYQLFTSSSCHSNTKFGEVSQGEAYWVSSKALATHASKVLRVITFN